MGFFGFGGKLILLHFRAQKVFSIVMIKKGILCNSGTCAHVRLSLLKQG